MTLKPVPTHRCFLAVLLGLLLTLPLGAVPRIVPLSEEVLLDLLQNGEEELERLLEQLDEQELKEIIELAYSKQSYQLNKPLIDALLQEFIAASGLPEPYVKSFQALFESLPEEHQQVFLTKIAILSKNYKKVTVADLEEPCHYFFLHLDYNDPEVEQHFKAILGHYIDSTGLFEQEVTGALLPEAYHGLVKDIFTFFLIRLNPERRATKITEQILFRPSSKKKEQGERLLNLIKDLPTLQKMGQIIARNPYLPEVYKRSLQELEDNLKRAKTNDHIDRIVLELAKRGSLRGNPAEQSEEEPLVTVELTTPTFGAVSLTIEREPLGAGTVAEVIPFVLRSSNGQRKGVFKLLKPGIAQAIEEEFAIMQDLILHFGKQLEQLQTEGTLPGTIALEDILSGKVDSSQLVYAVVGVADLKKLFREASTFIRDEVQVLREQRYFAMAHRYYEALPGATTPEMFCPDLCTENLTAMERAPGGKISKLPEGATAEERHLRALRLAGSFLIPALFQEVEVEGKKVSLFHGDPHAGNIFFDSQSDLLTFLDWGLLGTLSRDQRKAFLMLYLSVECDDRTTLVDTLRRLSSNWGTRFAERAALASFVNSLNALIDFLRKDENFKGDTALIAAAALLLALREGINVPIELSLFSKSLFTLDNVLKDLSPGVLQDKNLRRQLILRAAKAYPEIIPKSMAMKLEQYRRTNAIPSNEEFARRLGSAAGL